MPKPIVSPDTVGLAARAAFSVSVAALLAGDSPTVEVENLVGDLYQARITWSPKSVRREFLRTFSARKAGMDLDAGMKGGLEQALAQLRKRVEGLHQTQPQSQAA